MLLTFTRGRGKKAKAKKGRGGGGRAYKIFNGMGNVKCVHVMSPRQINGTIKVRREAE